MIRDGLLTHGVPVNELLVWRPASHILYGLLTAFLTTVLSYQAAALVLDLCFGIKRSGKSRISDIETVLLVRSSSPIAILYSLFPRIRSHGKATTSPNSTVIRNSSNTLRFSVVFKLLFLLAIVPLINMATIIFNLENTRWLTFEDAKFGGIGLGVNPDLSVQPFETSSEHCKRAIFINEEGEDVMSEFFNCEALPTVQAADLRRWGVIVAHGLTNEVLIGVQSPTHLAIVAVKGFVRVRSLGLADPDDERRGISTIYQLKPELTNRSAEMLVDYGLQMVEEICRKQGDTNDFRILTAPYSFLLFEGRAAVSKVMRCQSAIPDDPQSGGAVQVRDELAKRIGFIESSTFEVSLIAAMDADPFVSGKDLLLLRRRRSYVSVPILGILTCATIVLRIVVRGLTSNDIERGIGLVVRQALGMRCCDSMLAGSNISVKYEDEQEVTRFRSDL